LLSGGRLSDDGRHATSFAAGRGTLWLDGGSSQWACIARHQFAPVRGPVASALFYAGPYDVDMVMVADNVIKRAGILVAACLDRLMDEVSVRYDRIMSAFHASPAC